VDHTSGGEPTFRHVLTKVSEQQDGAVLGRSLGLGLVDKLLDSLADKQTGLRTCLHAAVVVVSVDNVYSAVAVFESEQSCDACLSRVPANRSGLIGVVAQPNGLVVQLLEARACRQPQPSKGRRTQQMAGDPVLATPRLDCVSN
jgi:hypothetical protein